MRKFIPILILTLTMIVACSGSDTSKDEPKVPIDPPPSESPKDVPYDGGFTKEQRVDDAKMIIALFDREYAPKQWKEDYLGISFQSISQEFLDKVSADQMDDIEFYESIAKYLTNLKDSHVHHFFPTSASVSLPIRLDDVDGHAVVVYVEDEVADKISLGDEVIEFGGVSTDEARGGLMPYLGHPNEIKQRRLATFYLSERGQKTFPYLPQEESVVLKLKSYDGEEREVELNWIRKGKELAEMNDEGVDLKSSKVGNESTSNFTNPLDKYRNHSDPLDSPTALSLYAHVAPFFSTGDNFIERNRTPYYSGAFVEDERKIGYVRINTFSSQHINLQRALEHFEEDIAYFEENTDILILDLNNNPGGSLCFGFQLASFFFDKPIAELNNQLRANRSTLVDFENAEYNDQLNDNDKKIAARIAEDIRRRLASGELLTDPVSLCNYDGKISAPYTTSEGQAITYTKPVLILANELSNSCGDYFPALMKDAGRATIFGAPTSGAGGAVIYMRESAGYSEIKFSYTITLAWRNGTVTTPDGVETNYLENVGVSPDIPYNVTLDDFYSGYQFYRDAAIEAALSLVDENYITEEEE